MSARIEAPDLQRAILKIVIVGHVDHGKSSLIGRLLHDTGSLTEGKLEELAAASERRGMPMEWSFLVDAFQAERDQAVTIDSTRIWFKSPLRDYVIIDAPGHRQFLRNMISGAASADAALMVIDAVEGVREQTRRHAYLLHLLGIGQVAVAINKMDLVDYAHVRFESVAAEITGYLGELDVSPTYIVPISARVGDNTARRSAAMAWYDGPTILEAIERFHGASVATDRPLRFPIQDVYKFDERRILVGRIESGTLSLGDTLLFSPSNRSARVKSIEAWNGAIAPVKAHAGQSIGITLDDPIFVERGEIASHAAQAPVLSTVLRAKLFWLGHEPLKSGKVYKLKIATRETWVTVESIDRVIDTETLAHRFNVSPGTDDIADVILRARDLLPLDEHGLGLTTGRFVLLDGFDTVAGGLISTEGYPDQRHTLNVKSTNVFGVDHRVTVDARARRNGHVGGVLWFTGLSGAGKTTLAMEVERRLFQKGYQVFVLDGDNVRLGLNTDLGFSPDDRSENIRRIGQVAALFGAAGFICITAFISPYRSDRDRARKAAQGAFYEIYVKASLATCEKRDSKGLYRRARAGEIADFTGISAPYEPPTAPALTIDTEAHGLEDCIAQALDFVERAFSLVTRENGNPPAAETREITRLGD